VLGIGALASGVSLVQRMKQSVDFGLVDIDVSAGIAGRLVVRR